MQDGEERACRFWRSVVGDVLPDVRDAEACFEELFAIPSRGRRRAACRRRRYSSPSCSSAAAIGWRSPNFDARLHPLCEGHAPLSQIESASFRRKSGARKPQAEFFHALLKACNCAPEQMLFVGDDFENDVAAPRRLGIRAVHLDRTGASADSIRSLTDLWTA
ncbi:MAG: HAD family hydrolase [Planctomycetaceae bacterium]